MNIIFSHGRSGKPDGQKLQALSALAMARGHDCQSIDYTDTQDPDIRTRRLADIVSRQEEPFCLVGSSMGGYASLVACDVADKALLRGVFLMAPALYLPRYQVREYACDIANIDIVHGWNDSVVLYEHSVRYAHTVKANLHLLDDNHSLTQRPELLAELFVNFLARAERLA